MVASVVSKRRQRASASGEAFSRSDQARVHRDCDTVTLIESR